MCIINWNTPERTLRCLSLLENHCASVPLAIVVVDNGSTGDSLRILQDWFDVRADSETSSEVARVQGMVSTGKGTGRALPFPLRIRRVTCQGVLASSAVNEGFVGGANACAAVALAAYPGLDYVHFLNNDAELTLEALETLVSVGRETGALIVGSRLFDESGRPANCGHRSRWGLFTPMDTATVGDGAEWADVFAVDGASMMVRTDFIRRRVAECGHLFDPRYFAYGEEHDLCWFAQRAAGRVVLALRSKVVHEGAGSSGGHLGEIRTYYVTRNKILLAQALLRRWERVLFHAWYFPSRLYPFLTRVFRGRWRSACAVLQGLFDGYSGRTGKWSRHMG